MPLVSVILPTHNRAPTLQRAVESVLQQSFTDLELMIVDDGSTDDSQKIVDALGDKRVRYHRLPQSIGAAAARNHGIEKTSSELVAFQDSDDEWLPEKLSMQLESIRSKDVGMVYGSMLRIDREGKEALFQAPVPEPESAGIYNSELQKYHVENIGIQSCLIKRECLNKSGLFDENLPALEDLELFIRLGNVCSFHRIETPLVKYYESEGISSNRGAQAKARKLLFQKHKNQLLTSGKRAVAAEMMRIADLERRAVDQSRT